MMKIASSDVAMTSTHRLETQVSMKKTNLLIRADRGEWQKLTAAAVYERSGGSAAAAAEAYRGTIRAPAERTPEERKAQQTQELTLAMQPCAAEAELDDASELKIKLLNRLLEAIGARGRVEPVRIGGRGAAALDLRGDAARAAELRLRSYGGSVFRFAAAMDESGARAGTSPGGTLWRRINVTSAERSEREFTAFASKGRVVTEDGRSMDFNIEFAMSRSFSERFDTLSAEPYVLTDPLIINLDGGAPSVSDVKFRFDLDSDGREEEISFAGAGSGFLALDRNGNGEIDDGSELFGTGSGDGFADLAAYDGDGNGWIDENDDVYAKLRVWVRDADGGDRLLDLKEANVGAIFLGSADTEFSLKDDVTNETDGVVRRTGVYLKESGGAGTLSHVDLRC